MQILDNLALSFRQTLSYKMHVQLFFCPLINTVIGDSADQKLVLILQKLQIISIYHVVKQ